MEIVIPRSVAAVLFVTALLATLAGLGFSVSPRSEAGRPVLLVPAVRAVEHYRRLASNWVLEWRALNVQLDGVMNGEGGLLYRSQSAERTFDHAIALARQVDAADTPASLIGLRDQLVATAQAFVQASLQSIRWVSAPSPESRAAADQAIARAERLLGTLESNEWIRNSK